MSATLSPQIGLEFRDASEVGRLFHGEDRKKVEGYKAREVSPICTPDQSCTTNLFFGFFFDGTKNSYVLADTEKNHSNVARLYDCYPGLSVPKVLPDTAEWKHKPMPSNFFKVYVPGIASPFKQIGDTGETTLRAATAALGERRIIWALLQAVNNVHRYFLRAPLISTDEAHNLVRRIFLYKEARNFMVGNNRPSATSKLADQDARIGFEEILKRLHRAVSLHWPNKTTGKPAKLDPGIVKTIYISVFGFSRGATEARAFLNWLQSLCKLDSQLIGSPGDMSLGGFPVAFDFLGLFDTVASVGSANTYGIVDGHGAWADAEDSLRIPPGVKCLHLVAAHELRRSFPVDSISVMGDVPEGCQEVVVPGVHSDIGCGYSPREQGRGVDPEGADMLSRIPLIMMYKEARLSGVPLKLELASPVAKARFALTAETIKAFNAYIAECRTTTGPLHLIMREQARKQIEWRLTRRTSGKSSLRESESFNRASNFDKNDLDSAALEFEEEIQNFLEWKSGKEGLYGRGLKTFFDSAQVDDWKEISTWWDKAPQPSKAVADFFDNYVHDSRAAFKLSGPDREDKVREVLDKWVARVKQAEDDRKVRLRVHGRGMSVHGKDADDGLTDDQRRAANEYAKTGQIPRMINDGRESFLIAAAGYLRYRKIYRGYDAEQRTVGQQSKVRVPATG